jgi:cyanate permease
MMLFGGYVIARSPARPGAVRDATGSFTATLWLVAAATTGLFALCASMSRERLSGGPLRARIPS